MKRIALVLDLDATLVDSMPDLRAALNVMLAELRRRELTPDEVHPMIGDGARSLGEASRSSSARRKSWERHRAFAELSRGSGFAAIAGNEF